MPFPVINGLRSLELGTPGPSRQRLVDLVMRGDKKATAGLMSEYETEGEPMEHVGEVLVLVDDDIQPLAHVRMTRVEQSRFGDVPWEFAQAENEGDLDIEDWRQAHYEYWTKHGEDISDDTTVVLLWFELVPNAES